MDNLIAEIEERFPVDTIMVNAEQAWPYLRIAVRSSLVAKNAAQSKLPEKKGASFNKVLFLKNVLYGLKNWFKPYDYVIFSDTSEIVRGEDKYINKLTHYICMRKPQKTLTIERPNPNHRPFGDLAFKTVVSESLLSLLKKIILLSGFVKTTAANLHIIRAIKKEYQIEFNEIHFIKSFMVEYKIYNVLLRLLRPRAVFLTCHSFIAARKAANDLKIHTIEIQHGSTNHAAYQSDSFLDPSFYPGFFLVFGQHDCNSLKHSAIYPQQKVRSVGSYYIDYVFQQKNGNKQLSDLTAPYNRSIGITLQWTIEGRLIPFVIEAARLNDAIVFLLIPRPRDQSDYSRFSFPANVILYEEDDFYHTVKCLDFHSTVFSTCALEAPSLGIQNILIDIGNLAKTRYGNILTDERVTRYVRTPAEFIDTILNFAKLDKSAVRARNRHIIEINYAQNMQTFLETQKL